MYVNPFIVSLPYEKDNIYVINSYQDGYSEDSSREQFKHVAFTSKHVPWLCHTLSLKQDLEFHGVMRFYFQDRVAGNFATKCIRVSSTATTQDVIETLAEKFRPDMRMLSSPKYSLYEVHVSGGEFNRRRGVTSTTQLKMLSYTFCVKILLTCKVN